MRNPNTLAEAMSDIVHDLKTPLASLKGLIEMLEGVGPLNEQQKRLSQSALASVQYMDRLIADMLELARIEAERPLEANDCDVDEVVRHAEQVMADYARWHKVMIEITVDPNVGIIQADTRRIDHMLTNLISNAIKYNRPNGVVRVQAAGYDDHVEITVSDTGMGIQAEDLPHVFERFFRSAFRGGRRIEGTGLGLAIVKAIVDKHGGQIALESVFREGTTVRVTLPRRSPLIEGADAHVQTSAEHPPRGVESDDRPLPHSLREVQDAIDDNLQEPPQTRLDRDDIVQV